ncbi:MAG: hypothetical protein ACETWK_09545 [Candidatus Aminicenantaceae bacterium]
MDKSIFIIFLIPFFLLILALLIWSLVWVYGDAERRGKPGWLVVLLVLFLDWPISLIVWLVFRPEVKSG